MCSFEKRDGEAEKGEERSGQGRITKHYNNEPFVSWHTREEEKIYAYTRMSTARVTE